MRRHPIAFFCSALLIACMASEVVPKAVAQTPAARPNVLFILVDDLATSLGCYGNEVVKTPNIDRLAGGGTVFEAAYTQYPVCNPSRTCLLSGRRPETTRVFSQITPPRARVGNVAFLPEHFGRQGYFTAGVGKIAHPGFEETVAWDSYQPIEYPEDDNSEADDGLLSWSVTDNPDEAEPDGVAARMAVDVMERRDDRPFFLAVGFRRPHAPFVAPRKYFDLYDPEAIPLPGAPPNDLDDVPRVAVRDKLESPRWNTPPAEQRQLIAAYFACVSFMDAQVGVLLEALDRLGIADETIVVFTSDHGFHLGEHGGIWGKGTLFEEDIRVPLVVAGPGATPARSRGLVETVDIYPTLADLCGLPIPDGLEGTSFAPLLGDPNREWKRAAFSTVRKGGVMGKSVRTEKYRYTQWGTRHEAELYDLEADPHEFVNLARDPDSTGVAASMRQTLRAGWRAALPRKELEIGDGSRIACMHIGGCSTRSGSGCTRWCAPECRRMRVGRLRDARRMSLPFGDMRLGRGAPRADSAAGTRLAPWKGPASPPSDEPALFSAGLPPVNRRRPRTCVQGRIPTSVVRTDVGRA
jgi:iduronate 2-sulfatase